MMKKIKKDYSYLKGKEIDFIGHPVSSYDYAFVAEIDEEKGITIKGTRKDSEKLINVWCISPDLFNDGYKGEGTLTKAFSWTIEQIEKGLLDMSLYPYPCQCSSCHSCGLGRATCAFE